MSAEDNTSLTYKHTKSNWEKNFYGEDFTN